VLVSDIKTKFRSHKRALSPVFCGHSLLKKYRLTYMARYLGCSKRQFQSNTSEKKRKSAVSSELKNHILQFYLRDDNSRSTLGKKDTITRHKVKKQLHILTDSCKNLHNKYLCENEDKSVSYATFLRLKPFWVVSQSVDRRNTFLCKTCDNLQLKANKMLKERLTKTAILQHLASAFCCSTDKVQCMFGMCVECSACTFPMNTDVFELSEDVDIEKSVSWNEWASATEKRKQMRSNGEVKEFEVKVTKKVEVCGTVGDLCDAFENDIRSKGCRHLFTLNHQYKILRQMKRSLGSNEVVLHIDFAENYNCKLSSEIQSFHFPESNDTP